MRPLMDDSFPPTSAKPSLSLSIIALAFASAALLTESIRSPTWSRRGMSLDLRAALIAIRAAAMASLAVLKCSAFILVPRPSSIASSIHLPTAHQAGREPEVMQKKATPEIASCHIGCCGKLSKMRGCKTTATKLLGCRIMYIMGYFSMPKWAGANGGNLSDSLSIHKSRSIC